MLNVLALAKKTLLHAWVVSVVGVLFHLVILMACAQIIWAVNVEHSGVWSWGRLSWTQVGVVFWWWICFSAAALLLFLLFDALLRRPVRGLDFLVNLVTAAIGFNVLVVLVEYGQWFFT